ncbi:MAG: head-tail adaptor protein [Armatimonadota bacterium]
MLSAKELASMRTAVAQTFVTAATLRRRTSVSDGQGGESYTYADAGTIRGRLQPRSANEKQEGGQLAGVTLWRWLCPHDTELRLTDRLRIDGADYEVTGTSAGMSDALELRADLVRID